MRILSVNVGGPRQVHLRDATVLTSIFKSPARGTRCGASPQPRRRQTIGPYSSRRSVQSRVLLPRSEHYPFWREQLPGMDLPYGMFGENLTTEDLLEDAACIGDRFRIGSAVLEVTQPRMPCFKLGIRFGRADIVKRFWQSGRSGIYFSVIEEANWLLETASNVLPRAKSRSAWPTSFASIAEMRRVPICSSVPYDLRCLMVGGRVTGPADADASARFSRAINFCSEIRGRNLLLLM